MTTSSWRDTQPSGIYTSRMDLRFAVRFDGYLRSTDKEERRMLAAMGFGLIGTVLLIVLVIAAIMFFVRRT